MSDVFDIDLDEAFAPDVAEGEIALADEPDFDAGAGSGVGRLQKILAAHADEDPLLGLSEAELTALGQRVVQEWEADRTANAEWRGKVERALDAATQEGIVAKTYPLGDKSSNVKYPLLTVGSLQFAARALPAIIRDDQAVQVKVLGPDPQGRKRQRADRVRDYLNHTLFYEVDDWEGGIDSMLHQLPTTGCAFRKVYHDPAEGPVVDFVPALNLTVPPDARSLKTAPRVTHDFMRHPYEIAELMDNGDYADVVLTKEGEDDQAPRLILEQHRMGLGDNETWEPFVVTVDKATSQVLRIEPGFDTKGADQESFRPKRWMPFVKVPFVPDMKGRFYDIGFGHFLEPLLETINTIINQSLDAGHAQVAGGGFVAASLRLQGNNGVLRWAPGEYKVVNAQAGEIQNSIYERTFPGASPVLFQLLGMMMEAARDIASINDVMTGDIPQNSQATTVLASIEQGLQVFSSIYKRVYRALREEFKLLADCVVRYGDPDAYAEFHDLRAVEAAQPEMGPDGQPMPMQAPPEPPPTMEADFDMAGLDLRPVSDPTTVTKMQSLSKAQFVLQFVGKGLVNDQVAIRRALEAADVPEIDELTAVQAPPPPPGMIEGMAVDMESKSAKAAKDRADALLKVGKAAEMRTGVAVDDPADPIGGSPMLAPELAAA